LAARLKQRDLKAHQGCHAGSRPSSSDMSHVHQHRCRVSIPSSKCHHFYFVNVTDQFILCFYYLRIENAEGYVLIAVYLFIYLVICMRVTRITQKVLNRIA